MTESFDAIVIGSGLGGLTAGALYAQAGNRVLLLERNASFGGAASTYHRGALTVEASLHETADPEISLDPKSAIFEALDLYDDIEFVPTPNFYQVRGKILGESFTLPHGFEAILGALVQRFPHQETGIRKFLKQVQRTLRAFEYMGGQHTPIWRLTHVVDLPIELWAVIKDFRSSLAEVMDRYFGNDEALKIALAANLPYYSDDPSEFWWLSYAIAQGGYLQGGVYIKGGSQTLSDRLVDLIRESGGEARAGCNAQQIEVAQDDSVSGVRYSDGEGSNHMAKAPIVFGNAAPHRLSDMLPEPVRADFMAPYAGKQLSISLFSATFGLTYRPETLGIDHYSTVLVPDWVRALDDYKACAALLGEDPKEKLPVLTIVNYSQIDSGLDQSGLYPVSVVCVDRLSNWDELDETAYEARRSAWLTAIAERLDLEWPGFKSAIREQTAATAKTMRDYLNTPEGAVYGFALIPPRTGPISPPMRVKTQIQGLWLASSYGGAGGFSGAMGCGAAAARAALKAQNRRI